MKWIICNGVRIFYPYQDSKQPLNYYWFSMSTVLYALFQINGSYYYLFLEVKIKKNILLQTRQGKLIWIINFLFYFYGHVLRRDDGHVLRKALEFEVKGKRKRGRPRKTWRSQVEKESKSVGLKKEGAKNRARWRVGVGEIAGRVG